LQAWGPSVAVGADETISVAWHESCTRQACSFFDDRGVWMASLDAATGDLLSRDRLTTGNESYPVLARFDQPDPDRNATFMAWTKGDEEPFSLEVVVPADGNRVIATLSETGERIWSSLVELAPIDGHAGVLHWQEGSVANGFTFFLADVDPGAETVGTARPLMTASLQDHEGFCSRVETDGSGTLAWLSAFATGPDAQPGDPWATTITVRLSEDGGHTFGDAIPIDFLLPPREPGGMDAVPEDSLCPAIAISESGKLFIAWQRVVWSQSFRLLTSVGTAGTPCAGPPA
jgi:hypothetical protein